eukprot:TRINITY_DN7504_c0_g1_i1.p1 TRINITY_DN7504_c0_g1~~TRINITY_DN7504_c0_g1_i1.p1  ORF type:complete len:442 (-),score=110.31 TRINITY_DN7504_c0_g1_i1:289-1614(-)
MSASINQESAILLPAGTGHVGKAEARRWWVLFVFSYAAGLQGLLWMTYSSVPEQSQAYLGTGSSSLDFMLSEGPIAYVLVLLPCTWLLSKPGGLRIAVVASCVMCLFASVFRTVPVWLPPAFRSAHAGPLMWFLYIAQFVNAAAAPPTQAAPSLLSQTWFSVEQRTTATAIARVSNAGGRAVGFFLGPAIVHAASDVPKLLYAEIAMSAVLVACALASPPSGPRVPPSRSASAFLKSSERTADVETKALSTSGPRSFALSIASMLRDYWSLLCQPTRFAALVVAFGLQMGMYGAWSGVLPLVLSSQVSAYEAALLGFVNTVAGIVGGVVSGWLAGLPRFAAHLKATMVSLAFGAAIAFGVLAVMLKPFSLLGAVPYWLVAVVCSLAGLLRGGLDPLAFELGAELAFPTPPGTAAGALTMASHLTMIARFSPFHRRRSSSGR